MQFKTQEERWIANHEGWTIRAGSVARYFDARGECPFADISQLFRLLVEKGRTSEFHKRIYLEMPWNGIDQDIAQKRGFSVWADGSIRTLYGATRAEVEEKLKLDAEAGDPFAIKAILTITIRRLGVI